MRGRGRGRGRRGIGAADGATPEAASAAERGRRGGPGRGAWIVSIF